MCLPHKYIPYRDVLRIWETDGRANFIIIQYLESVLWPFFLVPKNPRLEIELIFIQCAWKFLGTVFLFSICQDFIFKSVWSHQNICQHFKYSNISLIQLFCPMYFLWPFPICLSLISWLFFLTFRCHFIASLVFSFFWFLSRWFQVAKISVKIFDH